VKKELPKQRLHDKIIIGQYPNGGGSLLRGIFTIELSHQKRGDVHMEWKIKTEGHY
jgi:hypothetical protein